MSELAIHGGPKAIGKPLTERGLIGVEEKAAVIELFDQAIASGNAFGYNGEVEDAYCKEFAQLMGGGYADAVNSGTSAIYVALRALEIEPFTEVIVSCITDAGGMMPIAILNCVPVVADSAPGCYNTGAEQVEALVSELTSAMVVTHSGGEPADIEGIMAVARKHDLPVVEDCAQAHYARLHGRLLGTFGDIAAFSTMFGKHYCTGGQGGVVYTRDADLNMKCHRISDRGKPFGLPDGSTHPCASLNFNLNDLAAAIGRVQLRKLPRMVERRRSIVARLTEDLRDSRALIIPEQLPGAEPSYWFWRLGVDQGELSCDKDSFCAALVAEGVPIDSCYAYRAMPHTYDWFRNRRVFGSSGYPWACPSYRGDANREFPCPNAMATRAVQFNLNIHERLDDQDLDNIVAAFKKVESAYLV